MASENLLIPSLAHPFLRPGTSPLGAQEQRRQAASRATAWALVGALHVIFFFCFVLGIRPFDARNRTLVETILTLQMAGKDQQENPVNPQIQTIAPPRMLSAPIIVPKPPPIIIEEEKPGGEQQQGDVLGAVGRELACSAGSWEHLTSVERQRCGIYPWRGARLPNGSLVMVPRTMLPRLKEAPNTEFNVNSGADQVQAQVRSGVIPGQGGCPILQSTPCVHVNPNMRSATGDN